MGRLSDAKDELERLPWGAAKDEEETTRGEVGSIAEAAGELVTRLQAVRDDRPVKGVLAGICAAFMEIRSAPIDVSGGNISPDGQLGQIVTELDGSRLQAEAAQKRVDASGDILSDAIGLLKKAMAKLGEFDGPSGQVRDKIDHGQALAGDASITFEQTITAFKALQGYAP
jgi:hypothetical protein